MLSKQMQRILGEKHGGVIECSWEIFSIGDKEGREGRRLL
jgi:hypothetical protein